MQSLLRLIVYKSYMDNEEINKGWPYRSYYFPRVYGALKTAFLSLNGLFRGFFSSRILQEIGKTGKVCDTISLDGPEHL